MKLYEFTIDTFGIVKIYKRVIEVEEKPKTYMTVGRLFTSRINKSDIGVLSGYSKNTVLLLEDDFKKAKEIFLKKLDNVVRCLEVQIKNKKEDIVKTEKQILDLKEMNESQVETP